jgi:hypothetical protein
METAYDLQERLKRENAQKAIDQAERQAAEKRRLETESTYVPPKADHLLTAAELEAHRDEQTKRKLAEAEAGVETQRRDRARRAYVATTGSEEGFEGIYTSTLRRKMIEAETMQHLGQEDVAVGEVTADGSVRW